MKQIWKVFLVGGIPGAIIAGVTALGAAFFLSGDSLALIIPMVAIAACASWGIGQILYGKFIPTSFGLAQIIVETLPSRKYTLVLVNVGQGWNTDIGVEAIWLRPGIYTFQLFDNGTEDGGPVEVSLKAGDFVQVGYQRLPDDRFRLKIRKLNVVSLN